MADLVSARAYVSARMFGPAADAWLALNDQTATRTMSAATGYLDRIAWLGTATGIGEDLQPTTLQWPRSGVVVDGVTIDSTKVPVEIKEATYELAVAILADPEILGRPDQGNNIRSASGGGGSVSYWAPVSAATGTASRLPYVVAQLVGKFISAGSANAPLAFGSAGNATSSMAADQLMTVTRAE